MLSATREHDHITLLDRDRLDRAEGQPALARCRDVERNDGRCARIKAIRHHLRWRRQNCEWVGELPAKMDSTREAYDAQNIGQDIHPSLFWSLHFSTVASEQ